MVTLSRIFYAHDNTVRPRKYAHEVPDPIHIGNNLNRLLLNKLQMYEYNEHLKCPGKYVQVLQLQIYIFY